MSFLIQESRPIMEYLIEDKHPLAIHAAQNQCCTTENENGLEVSILILTLIQSTLIHRLINYRSPLFLTIEQGLLKYCHFSNLEETYFHGRHSCRVAAPSNE
jgi:hypothetical protein